MCMVIFTVHSTLPATGQYYIKHVNCLLGDGHKVWTVWSESLWSGSHTHKQKMYNAKVAFQYFKTHNLNRYPFNSLLSRKTWVSLHQNIKSSWILHFWCKLTQDILKKRLLNGCLTPAR